MVLFGVVIGTGALLGILVAIGLLIYVIYVQTEK